MHGALPLAVDLQPIRFRTPWLEFLFAACEQPLFERDPVQVVWQRPAQANALGAFDVALKGLTVVLIRREKGPTFALKRDPPGLAA